MTVLARLDARPTWVVFAGRAVAQAGFFLFLILPAFRLSDADFNDFTVTVVVTVLAVVAPGSALQQHLVRLDEREHPRDLGRVVGFGLAGAVAGVGLAALIVGPAWWQLLVVLGGVASLQPTYVTSVLAIQGSFGLSALVDAMSGIVFAVGAIGMFASDGGVVAYSTAYLVVCVVVVLVSLPAWRLIRSTPPHPAGSSGSMFRHVFAARWMVLIGVMAMAFNRTDYLILTVVGSEAEASRYTLAGRLVGPTLVALGSLNNSLYVRQVIAPATDALGPMTQRVSRRMGLLAAALCPAAVGVVVVLGQLSAAFADRSLELPTLLLGLATVPYAFAVPFAFGLAALHHEKAWLLILVSAIAVDALLVAAVGHAGAVAAAGVWVGVQVGVAVVTIAVARRVARSLEATVPHALQS